MFPQTKHHLHPIDQSELMCYLQQQSDLYKLFAFKSGNRHSPSHLPYTSYIISKEVYFPLSDCETGKRETILGIRRHIYTNRFLPKMSCNSAPVCCGIVGKYVIGLSSSCLSIFFRPKSKMFNPNINTSIVLLRHHSHKYPAYLPSWVIPTYRRLRLIQVSTPPFSLQVWQVLLYKQYSGRS